MTSDVRIRWIQVGIVAGLCASVLYPMLIFTEFSPVVTAALAAGLGPAIGIGSVGLRELIRVERDSVSASLGAISNFTAGALFAAMALIQLAARSDATPGARELVGIWLGLDVAWDVYIGIGTVCFALAMRRHPRFRWPFAGPGLALGILVIVLNLLPFPTPPAEAGSVDVGPFVGLWYLAATVQTWRSLTWARARLGTGSDG